MHRSSQDQAIEAAISPACQEQGVDLVDVRYLREPDGAVLRVMIEHPGAIDLPPGEGGVTLEECSRLSRAIGALLDAAEESGEPLIKGAYQLEVGSAGVERPLVKDADFEKFNGKEIRLKTIAPVDGARRFQGVLEGFEGGVVQLRDQDGLRSIPLDKVTQANLVFRFD